MKVTLVDNVQKRILQKKIPDKKTENILKTEFLWWNKLVFFHRWNNGNKKKQREKYYVSTINEKRFYQMFCIKKCLTFKLKTKLIYAELLIFKMLTITKEHFTL